MTGSDNHGVDRSGLPEHCIGRLAPSQSVVSGPADRVGPALIAAGIGVWSWSATTGRIEWDATTGVLFDQASTPAEGPLETWADVVHESDRDEAVAAVLAAVEHRGAFDLEHRLILATGAERWLRLAGHTIVDGDAVVGVGGVVEDVTERVVGRERERAHRQRLEVLAAINAVLDDAEDADDVMRRVSGVVASKLGVEARLALTEPLRDGGACLLSAHCAGRTVPDAADSRTISPAVADVLRAGQPAIIRAEGDPGREALIVPLRKQGRSLGFMELQPGQQQIPFGADDLSLIEALAARVAASVENRRLRAERDRTALIDSRMADFGTKLAAAPDVVDVLAVMVRHAAAVIGADHIDVAITVDADHLKMVDRYGSSIVGSELDLGADDPIGEAARTGDIVYAHPAPDSAGAGALAASPLYDDDRQTIGVLAFRWDTVERFDGASATSLRTVSRLCGQSLRRAILVRETRELAELASSLASARASDDVVSVVTAFGVEALCAEVRLEILQEDGPGAGPALGHSAIVGPRTRRSVELPLLASTGTSLGGLTLSWGSAVRVDAPMRSRLQTLAGLTAQTLERTLLAESEHAVIAALQKRLLPPLPDVPGYRLRALYEPAASSIGIGGDWYEVIPLDDGTLIAVIGDVVGHGVDAIADMAQIQNLITGLAATGTPVPQLLSRTNAMLTAARPIYATALLLHIDGPGRRLSYQNAAHPWGLLRHGDGSVEMLEDRHHSMLGTTMAVAGTTTVPFPSGASVVAYTDGLIERRDEAITDGISRLARHVAHDISRPLAALVAAVRADGNDAAATTDDLAVLAIENVPAT